MLLASLIAMVGRSNEKCACLESRVHQLEAAARERAFSLFQADTSCNEEAGKM